LHFLQHLHEDFGRRLGATQLCGAARDKAVLDQGGNHRLGETPRPLDLIGLACDQRLKRSRALDQAEAEVCSCFLAFFKVLMRRRM